MSDRRRIAPNALLMPVLTAVLSALALGALGALLASAVSIRLLWLCFGAAIGMAISMRFSLGRPSATSAVLAALGTLLAVFYAGCLQALMRLSAQLGLPLLEVIHSSGITGTMQLGWLSLHGATVYWSLAAAASAFALTLWWPRRLRIQKPQG